MVSPGRLRLSLPLIASLILAAPAPGLADDSRCAQWVARVVSVQGRVEARLGEATATWRPVTLESRLCAGDTLRVQANGRAAIELRNETVVRLDQHTTLTLGVVEERSPSWLELIKGAVHFITRTPRSLEVKTPYVNAAVEGTEFQLRVTDTDTRLWVYEGRVLASNTVGSQRVASGQALIARAGAAPQITLDLKPQDAVHWTLYYPTVVDFRANEFVGSAADSWQASTAASIGALRAGDAATALERVMAVGQPVADVRFYTYRASLLLSVGRVEAAQDDLRRARERAANDASALALEAIIFLAQGDAERAFALAQRAVTADAESVAAHLALSYSQQARLKLDTALASARTARDLGRSAVADARLAELLLAQGDVGEAERRARAAVGRGPGSARSQSILGFAYLAKMRTASARVAFEQAIRLDSADPLARLGLGLARIREGKLTDGRREIEIATALDPSMALVRSYLGKAYYEEKRNRLAADQFTMAKELDPNDPTPWFYDALRKQTENRPAEALADVQESINRNDNRAVYRSQLLLDQDLAARSAGLGRIYADLGFQQSALVEGWRSVNRDPTNFSAHRLLADSYSSLPRHETARLSELLKAQLLQPINVQPIQPQLSESNLPVLQVGGPSVVGLNEFNPLFARDQVVLQANGLAGSNDTRADDLVVSGIEGGWSWSFGQFHFSTDGDRPNSDYRQNVYNAFTQYAVNDRLSIQGEVRTTERLFGDIKRRLDPTAFFTENRNDINSQSARLGLHYAPSPASSVLVSAQYLERKQVSHAEDIRFPLTLIVVDATEEPRGYTTELQYIGRGATSNLTVGAGYYRDDRTINANGATFLGGFPLPPPFSGPFTTNLDVEHASAYGYWNARSGPDAVWTLGLGYDDHGSAPIDIVKLSPKIGLTWDLGNAATLRAAGFRNVARPLLASQTIEPTQVAGFNQFFDDPFGTLSTRYGIGVDGHVGADVFLGVEATRRYLEVFSAVLGRAENVDEQLHRAYLHSVLSRRWALRTEYQYEWIDRELAITFDPKTAETQRFIVDLRYADPSGFFASLRPMYIRQEIDFWTFGGGTTADQERFWVTDFSLGYRLPRRLGVISLTVSNITDKEFRYQDTDLLTSESRVNLLLPERAIYGRLSLNF